MQHWDVELFLIKYLYVCKYVKLQIIGMINPLFPKNTV